MAGPFAQSLLLFRSLDQPANRRSECEGYGDDDPSISEGLFDFDGAPAFARSGDRNSQIARRQPQPPVSVKPVAIAHSRSDGAQHRLEGMSSTWNAIDTPFGHEWMNAAAASVGR
jgi:hypothetical protein